MKAILHSISGVKLSIACLFPLFCCAVEIPKVYRSLAHHFVRAIEENGATLEIEDGSVWTISPSGAAQICTWSADAPILITQTDRWFSDFTYRLINTKTNAEVEANLYLGPKIDSPRLRLVALIDLEENQLALSDGTRWQISPHDKQTFHSWEIDDAIILGKNSQKDAAQAEHLLINVNTNQYVRAGQF